MWAAEASHARAAQIAERGQRGPDYVHRDLVTGLIRNMMSVLRRTSRQSNSGKRSLGYESYRLL
jgi:hypothetical protein